ncbi:MAG: hypothetical protein AABZ60_04230, partial [Planctomycetota bacterium]
MKPSIRYFVFCWSMVFSLCLAQTNADLEKYIQQLGHEDYTVREYAEQQIIRAGSRSIPFLKKALESGDAEVSWRAETLLEEIQQKLKDPKKKSEEVPLPPKSDNEESETTKEEPEILNEETESNPLLEELDSPKVSRQFNTSSISIIQNGKMFQVNGRSDGSFKVRTEEVLANGQKEVKDMTYESEADFQSGNSELYKKYKKASEGFSFERITPRIKKPQPSFGFGFGGPDSQFESEDFADFADILQELLKNDGELDFQRLLQKNSTQRLLEKALGSFMDDDPQLKQMLEMQKEMMRQFSGGGGLEEDDILKMQKEMMRQFGFDLDIFGNDDSSTPKKKRLPPKKKVIEEKKAPPESLNEKVFEETMEAHAFKGLELASMTEALQNHLPYRGVVVAKAEGKAQEVGLLPYDLILSINDLLTPTPEEAVKV